MAPTLDIYKASAGSGKTFLLTIKYLLLLFRDPEAYRSTLAVTFTNKATAEMKERILDVLTWLAAGNPKATPYRVKLLEELPGHDEAALKQEADLLYRSILHDYSRFSVNTIDSFVQRIVRSFAWEIGIDGGFQLQMDTTPVKEDLADRMYKRLDTDEKLRDWVVDLARERLGEGKGWSVKEDMVQLAEELFKERFAGFEEGLRTVGDDAAIAAAFSDLMRKLTLFIRNFEETWQAKAKQVVDWMEQNGLDAADFNYGKAGFIGFFIKAANGVTDLPGSRFTDAVFNQGKLASGKAPAAAKATIEGWRNRLEAIGNDMLVYRANEFPFYAAAQAIRKNLGILRIMRVFYEELKHYRTENNKLLMSDTHLLLRQLTRDTSASFIYEKTGSRYRHFLIDEFQDTSGFQWDNFRPLMENAMSEGSYNLIVGDVKQAIYRWRNGDWRLLLSEVQRQLGNAGVEEHTLQDNRRSARQVIEFNNYLFFATPRLLQNQMDAEIRTAPSDARNRLSANGYGSIFMDAYADALQQVPDNASENGYAQIRFIPQQDNNDEPVDYAAVVLADLHQTILSLLEEGFQPSDLAILVRTNAEAADIVQYLLEAQQAGGRKYDLLSGDALLLANYPAIQLLVCALKVLADSKDKPALAQLRYLNVLQNGQGIDAQAVFAANGGDYGLPPGFAENKVMLKALPVSELVHQLIALFGLHQKPEHSAYLVAFQDMVFNWGKFGEQGLAAFLQYWDDEGCKKSLPGGANTQAVEVITIHKSKGLAFTVVLMPYLNWKLVHDAWKAPQLWVETAATPFSEIPVVPVRYRSALAESVFAYDYFEEQVLCVMDNLNVLYVGFTRARQRIYGWAPKEEIKDSSGINTMGKLLQTVVAGTHSWQADGLTDTRSGYDPEALCWTYGSLVAPVAPANPKAVAWMPPLHYHHWKQGLQVRFRPLATEETAADKLPRERGVLMHEALAQMQHAGEVEQVITLLLTKGLITKTISGKMQQQLEAILALPVFHQWRAGQMQRLAERALLTESRELRRPDWVLYNDAETVVVDFKFTEDETDQAKHVQQVSEYMQLLERAGFGGLQGCVVYGNSLKLVKVPG